MTQSTLPGTGPWSWLEPGLWVYRSRELDLLGQADGLLADAVPAAQQGGAALLEVKRRLHAAGVGAATAPASVGGGGHRYVVQVGIQFLAGYRDLTLRDVAHVGHGALLAPGPGLARAARAGRGDPRRAARPGHHRAGHRPARRGGAGGRQHPRLRTPNGWEISGRKTWVARVLEADAFVVFARSPEHLGAFYVPAGAAGLTAEPAPEPDGAEPGRGWSWGDLVLDKVAVPPTAVLGAAVGGVAVFRRHLADYRPLVAATCLGAAAAAVDDWVERVLAAPNAGSGLPDPVIERLGDLRGRVLLALGGLFTGAAGPGTVDSSWSKMAKAQAVNTAIEVVRAVVAQMETVPGGVPADALAEVRRVRAELTAFEAADGARAPLLRSAGERFVQYSAAILDEISEPTSTMPRPNLSD
jgi:alkylation response protein AidB-like acyl-CoA dehydrogenase